MVNNIEGLIKTIAENKLLLATISAAAGALFTKLLPFLATVIGRTSTLLSIKLGGRFALRNFEKRYLDWVATENRELRLPGVVSNDEAKKPLLDQVFVSLLLTSSAQLNETSIGIEAYFPRQFYSASEFQRLVLLQERLNAKEGQKKNQIPRPALRSLRQLRLSSQRTLALSLLDWQGRKGEWRPYFETWYSKWESELRPAVEASQLRYILEANQRIAILGAPGAGKTTLLQYIALTLARNRCGDKRLKDRQKLFKEIFNNWKVPILIRLSSLAGLLAEERRAGRDPSLLDLLPGLLSPDLQKQAAGRRYLHKSISKGRAILLLDGLDEVATDQDFRSIVRVIESTMITYSDNQYIVTSRLAGWRGGLRGDFTLFQVNDLSSEQVGRFVRTWYSAVEQNSVIGPLEDEGQAARTARERRARQRADDLLLTLQENLGIRRIASNPMLLSIIALVHRNLATLPKERSKLYSECSKILLEQWDIFRGVRVDDTNLRLDQKETIMMRIAIAYHKGEIGESGGGREASRDEVTRVLRSLLPILGREEQMAEHLLQRLIDRSGLLIERRRGVLSFSHQTFQEYFAARHLAVVGAEEAQEFLLHERNLLSDWWREVILLYSGMVPDASSFLLLVRGTESSDDLFLRRLRIAAFCSAEAVQIQRTDVRSSIVGALAGIREPGLVLGDNLKNRQAMSAYLFQWARSQQWLPSAAIVRIRNLEVQEGALLSSLVMEALRDREPEVRRAALTALRTASSIPASILEHVVQLMNDDNIAVAAASAILVLEVTGMEKSGISRAIFVLERELSQATTTGVRPAVEGLSSAGGERLLEYCKSQRRLEGFMSPLLDHIDWRSDEGRSVELEELADQVVREYLTEADKTRQTKLRARSDMLLSILGRSVPKFVEWARLGRTVSNEEVGERRITSVMSRLGAASIDMDSNAVKQLTLALTNGNGAIRGLAVDGLVSLFVGQCKCGGPFARDVKKILDVAAAFEALAICRALAEFDNGFEVGADNLEFWHTFLSSRSGARRAIALLSLRRVSFPLTTLDLNEILQNSFADRRPMVRAAAVRAAGSALARGLSQNVEGLIWYALRDPNPLVRIACIEACGDAWDHMSNRDKSSGVLTEGMALLIKLHPFASSQDTDKSSSRRKYYKWRRVASAVARIGQKLDAETAFDQLLRRISKIEWVASGQKDFNVDELGQELVELGRAAGCDFILRQVKDLLGGTDSDRMLMLELVKRGLVKEGIAELLQAIKGCIDSIAPRVRISCIEAVRNLGRDGVQHGGIEILLRALEDEVAEVRECAWAGLKHLDVLKS